MGQTWYMQYSVSPRLWNPYNFITLGNFNTVAILDELDWFQQICELGLFWTKDSSSQCIYKGTREDGTLKIYESLSVFTLKYTFCMGWHSCWCLMLNDMIRRSSWEVTQELELPIFNRTAVVQKSVQHNTKLIPLCLLQCCHSLFASFSLPSI